MGYMTEVHIIVEVVRTERKEGNMARMVSINIGIRFTEEKQTESVVAPGINAVVDIWGCDNGICVNPDAVNEASESGGGELYSPAFLGAEQASRSLLRASRSAVRRGEEGAGAEKSTKWLPGSLLGVSF